MNYGKFGFPVPIGAVAGSYYPRAIGPGFATIPGLPATYAGGYGGVIPNYSYATAPFYGKTWPI
jgi:hypothetical protein